MSCKKIPFDNRNKYWGTWKFTYSVQTYIYNGSGYGPISYGEYTGKVYYDKKNKDKTSIFLIFRDQVDQVPLNIDKSGNFIGCVSGKFSDKNNVEFIYSSNCDPWHGLGAEETYTVTGKKQ